MICTEQYNEKMSTTLERSERDMRNLILNSLEIRNFRCFKHLQIKRLGRVNLIVGKNNVGKSTLLEAPQLYTHDGAPNIIWKILQARDESKPYSRNRTGRFIAESLLPDLKHLFHGRKELGQNVEAIVIGPIASPDAALSISIGWYTRKNGAEGVTQLRLLQPNEYDIDENSTPRFTIKVGTTLRSHSIRQEMPVEEVEGKAGSIFIAPDGLDDALIGAFWDEIALTDLEKDIVEAMRIIAPGIERLSVVGNFDSRERIIRSSKISAVLYDEEDLAVATREQIEVR
ncbi:MAG: hypothetical protein PVSMB5_13160 [Ktedonobacteraceae bacterium]